MSELSPDKRNRKKDVAGPVPLATVALARRRRIYYLYILRFK